MITKSLIFLIVFSLSLEAGPFKRSAVIDAFKDYKQNRPSSTVTKKPISVKPLPKESVLNQFKTFKNAQTKTTPKVSSSPVIIKRKPKVLMPVTVKKPVQVKSLKPVTLPTRTTTSTFNTFKPKVPTVAKTSESKATLIKNSTLSTTTKVGNVDAKGKLNVSNINVAKGTEIKNSNITTNVKAKNISVSKGANSEIGSVNIE